jgi:hypothetical protein
MYSASARESKKVVEIGTRASLKWGIGKEKFAPLPMTNAPAQERITAADLKDRSAAAIDNCGSYLPRLGMIREC